MRQGYDEVPQTNVVRQQMDAGPAEQRRRSTVTVRRIRGQMLLTKPQLATFRGFFDNDLKSGVLPFEWVDPITSTPVQMRFVADEAPYRVQPAGAALLLTVTLEILP